jgi:hypothetical protein
MFAITDRSALRDLGRLVESGLARRHGEGRSARYSAADVGITEKMSGFMS